MNPFVPIACRWMLGVFCLAAAGAVPAAPAISSFSPTFGAFSDPGFITINGTGFWPGTLVVRFNGVTNTSATAVSDTQIQATVPAGAPLGAGPIYVSVNGVGTYSADDFTVIGAGPYVSSFSPVIGAGGADVTIFGAHFSSPITVSFNGATSTTNVGSSSQFVIKAPPNVVSGPITVTTAAGSWTTSSNFFVPPVITGFSPTNGRAGTNILIMGTNFLGATDVRFNGTNASFTVLSNRAIQATVPVGATTGPIRVIAPAGSAFSAANFVVPPTITGFTPTNGIIGTSVTVSGANFNVGMPTVKFGSATSTSVTGVSFGQLTATVPGAAVTGPITVTTADGTATSPTLFYLPPRITTFTPSNSAPGSTVTINGTNFTDAFSLKFNGTPAAFAVSNNNIILATVPSGFVTGPLTVIAPGGTNSTAGLAQSNFFAAPIITSFSPVHGLPGTNVTIFGTNFFGTTLITFNGTPGTGLTVLSNYAARITVPNGASSGPIALTAPAGTATTAATFFLDYAPVLTLDSSTPPLVRLLWAQTFYTYGVEQNNDLAIPSGWLGLPLGIGTLNGSNVVTTTNLGGQMYFRLKR